MESILVQASNNERNERRYDNSWQICLCEALGQWELVGDE